jgi:AcrR family transcriptional regulator
MSSASSRRDERTTRERVLDAAMDLFGRQGYHATTVA